MIIHHMSDGAIRENIEGVILPKSFNKVYSMIHSKKKVSQNEDSSKSKTINKSQVLH